MLEQSAAFKDGSELEKMFAKDPTLYESLGEPVRQYRRYLAAVAFISGVPAVVTLAYVATVAYPMASVEPRTLVASLAVVVLLALILVSNFLGPRSLPDRILGTAVVAK